MHPCRCDCHAGCRRRRWPPTFGGGGTTLAGSDDGVPVPVPFELTVGGGGTTSEAPKILPIRLLMNDPLPVCVGGGGTTVLRRIGNVAAGQAVQIARDIGGRWRRDDRWRGQGQHGIAREWCARAKKPAAARLLTFAICTGALEISRLTDAGAGGITFVANAGAERAFSRVTLGAGATTEALRDGRIQWRSRATTVGAGGITAEPSAGATRRVFPRNIRRGWNDRRAEIGRGERLIAPEGGSGGDHAVERDTVARVVADHVRSGRDDRRGKIGQRCEPSAIPPTAEGRDSALRQAGSPPRHGRTEA